MANLDQEIAALRRFADLDIEGNRIAFAFCYGDQELGRDWLFDIHQNTDGHLIAVVDRYTASGLASDGFDVDAWEENKLTLASTDSSRKNYRELVQVCRAMLNGRDVKFYDGTLIHGIRRAA